MVGVESFIDYDDFVALLKAVGLVCALIIIGSVVWFSL